MLHVATYNIRKAIGTDRVRKPERILEVLEELNADVIALQEADRRFGARFSALPIELLAERSGYKPVPFDMRPGSLGWHGNALLVRKSARIISHRPLHLSCVEPRGAVLADIEVNHIPLRVLGMHLDLSGLQRRRQAQQILAELAEHDDLPTVMMGDLNEWNPRGACLREFGADFQIAHSTPSFHARRPMARLDRIMVSPHFEIVASGTHHSPHAAKASDHLPVWARLKMVQAG